MSQHLRTVARSEPGDLLRPGCGRDASPGSETHIGELRVAALAMAGEGKVTPKGLCRSPGEALAQQAIDSIATDIANAGRGSARAKRCALRPKQRSVRSGRFRCDARLHSRESDQCFQPARAG